jgi:hypothetical protein
MLSLISQTLSPQNLAAGAGKRKCKGDFFPSCFVKMSIIAGLKNVSEP